MKKASAEKTAKAPTAANGMREEYDLDYAKAKPNRFAGRKKSGAVILLEPAIARVFKTGEAVNSVLRALIETMPKTGRGTAA